MRTIKRISVGLVILSLFMAVPVRAALFIVNNPGDGSDYVINGVCETQPGNRTCTLRAAVEEATARGGRQWITIGQMDITLSKLLSIAPHADLRIIGAGIGKTVIHSTDTFLGHLIQVRPNAKLFLEGVTLTSGRTQDPQLFVESCIRNDGQLTLDRVRVTGCWMSPYMIQAGGGITNTSDLRIFRSIIDVNSVYGWGGGVYNSGSMIVQNSLFLNNLQWGSGIHTDTAGGALANDGTAVLTNTTFSSNSSGFDGGAIYQRGGSLILRSVTFAEQNPSNGSAILLCGGTTRVINTLFGDTSNSNCGSSFYRYTCAGTLISDGFNLSSDETCALNRATDQRSVDPRLGPLANNGGWTMTYALLSGSPALDRGACSFGLDQRGYLRPIDLFAYRNAANGCDIGAYERQRWERN